MRKDTITSPSNPNPSTTASTASFIVNSSSSRLDRKKQSKRETWSWYLLWWNRPNTCDIKHSWSTWQNDGLHLVVLPQNPQKQTSQIQRIDELPQSTTCAPDLQSFTFLYNTNTSFTLCTCETLWMWSGVKRVSLLARYVLWINPGITWPSSMLKLSWAPTCWWGWRRCISDRTAEITP